MGTIVTLKVTVVNYKGITDIRSSVQISHAENLKPTNGNIKFRIGSAFRDYVKIGEF
jgi:hypothetical protein